nr:PREDICTED: uncharacterized protein LOC106707009 [Latimeria chalumnae]|eukprot:XP_014354230.1 PREDICTED: uncharacterized protein LOC106707009 [Latimeria chalumnae]
MIIHFVKCEAGQQVKIHEHFLGFIPVIDSHGFQLTEVILDQLKEMVLQLKDMRGQGCDNGSNMKGKHAGVQKQILDKNPHAFFVPCSCHSLNLVANDAAMWSKHAVSFFILLQEIYVFFSSSSYRWAVLKEHVSNFTVKPLSTTRWESRVDAFCPIMYQLGEVYDALLSIANDTLKDPMTRHKAEAIAGKMLDFQFLYALAIWHKVLNQINIASKLLQSPNFDLPATIKVHGDTVTFLQDYHSDEGFQSVIEEAKQLAQVIAHTSVSERFQQLHEVCQSFHFLYDISGLNNLSATVRVELLKKCKDLQVYLSHGNNADIDVLEIFDELTTLSRIVESRKSPFKMLQYLAHNNLINTFPNTSIALCILITIPVSVASGEQSFSKLKLIKTYLHSTMSQERESNRSRINSATPVKLDKLNSAGGLLQ